MGILVAILFIVVLGSIPFWLQEIRGRDGLSPTSS